MLVATFGQVRFSYYLAVNVGLLGGAACAELLGTRQPMNRAHRIRGLLATGALACVIVGPGVPMLLPRLTQVAPVTADWHDALGWLRTRTAEPFDTPDQYFARGGTQVQPAAFSVMAWWDYGYWITRVSRRVPVANPRQTGMDQAAAFFVAPTEADGNHVLDGVGARYVIVNDHLQAASPDAPRGSAALGLFATIAHAARLRPEDYCGHFEERGGGAPVVRCHPEYYQTMAMRLYLHGGRAVTPAGQVTVVSFVDEVRDRMIVKRITGEDRFATYEDARAFVSRMNRADMRILCRDLHSSCVPLEPLERYTPVFRSLGRDGSTADGGPSVVQVYEYHPAPAPRP